MPGNLIGIIAPPLLVCYKKKYQLSRKETGNMGGMRGRVARLFLALVLGGLLWMQELAFNQRQSHAGPIFQSYTKAETAPDFSLENMQGKAPII